MAKKKRGRRMPKWKKWVKAGLGIAGTVIGSLVATSPLHRGITKMVTTGDVNQGVVDILFDVGVPGPGNFNLEVNKVIGVGVTVAVGVGLMSLFKYIARRV